MLGPGPPVVQKAISLIQDSRKFWRQLFSYEFFELDFSIKIKPKPLSSW